MRRSLICSKFKLQIASYKKLITPVPGKKSKTHLLPLPSFIDRALETSA